MLKQVVPACIFPLWLEKKQKRPSFFWAHFFPLNLCCDRWKWCPEKSQRFRPNSPRKKPTPTWRISRWSFENFLCTQTNSKFKTWPGTPNSWLNDNVSWFNHISRIRQRFSYFGIFCKSTIFKFQGMRLGTAWVTWANYSYNTAIHEVVPCMRIYKFGL